LKRLISMLSALVRGAPVMMVVITLLLTVGFAVLARDVQTATGNEGFAPDNAELAAAETIGQRFGETGEEVMQVLLTGPNVVSADGLAAVAAITEAVAASESAPLLAERAERPAVLSYLAPVQMALAGPPPGVPAPGQAPGAPGADALPPVLDDDTIATLFRDALAQMPPEQSALLVGLLPDGVDPSEARADAGLVLVFVNTATINGDSEGYFDRLIEVQVAIADAVAAADLPEGYDAEAFAFPLLFADQDSFNAELGRLFGSAFLIIVVILGVVYWVKPRAGYRRIGAGRRTVADVLLTMATIIMAILWMNGMATLLGPGKLDVIGGLSEVSQIVPVLLIGLGVDYAIHLTTRYREEVAEGADVADGIARAVRSVGIALVLATMTTVVGFLTNIVNPVPALRDFGIVAAVGILSAFVLMIVFVPSVRLLLDRRAEAAGRLPRASFSTTSERILPGMMARTAVLAERAPIPTLLITVVLGGSLGIWGLTQLETRFSATDFVADDSPVVATFDAIVERFGGGFGETTEVLLTGDVATPAAHNALVAATADLAGIDGVATYAGQAQAESPVTVLAGLLAPAPDGSPSAFAPQAAALGVQADLTVAPGADVAALYRAMLATAPEFAGRVLAAEDGRPDVLRVAIQTIAGEEGAGALREDLLAAFGPAAAAGVTVVATSNPIINHVIISALQESQVSSLMVTLLAALVLLVVNFTIQYRRPALGVITIAPVALVVLWTFGMMAATGIPFGPVTATIAALAIGIGVPYTIHITHRYLEDRARFDDPAEAVRSTVRHTGGALAGSAFTTMAGFGILVTSSLTPFRQFGLVTAYAIGFALLAAAIVLPSMLALWDAYHRRRGDLVPATATTARPDSDAQPHPAGV
jgi:uncharacterized protein